MHNGKNAPTDEELDDWFDIEKTVYSNQECTGLMQTPPYNDDESESYSHLYKIHKTQAQAKNRNPNENKK